MKKVYIILISLAVFILILSGLIIALIYFYQPCGGVIGIGCREGNANIHLDNLYGAVEYNESYGSVCPIGIKFLGSKNSPEIKCQCPDGYEMDGRIIGYSTGKECYGSGTECPIMASECITKIIN